jgi:hypothetical protein
MDTKKEKDMKKTITIPMKEYIELANDQKLLHALYIAGVDNWDGIEYAYAITRGEE